MRYPKRRKQTLRLCMGLATCFALLIGRSLRAQETAKAKTFFSFEKTGTLFSKPRGMASPGPYYTCLVKMDQVKHFPFEYALYFSTDHHNGRGGIWMYLCNGAPSDPANWKSYDQALADGDFDYLQAKPKRNPIFVDTRQGSQTETPHANVIDGTVYMTYHNKLLRGGQATMLAISPDGVNFKRINGSKDSIILGAGSGVGHTGYFRWAPNPFHRVDCKYVGYSLHGGGDNYHSAMWGSNNAIKWDKLQVFTPMEGYAMAEKDMIMIWHEIDPNTVVRIGGDEYVAVSAGGNRASGDAARVVELYEVFLAGDGKTMSRECRKIVARGPAGSLDHEEAAEPTMVRLGETWHLIYVGASQNGKLNTVMAARGRFNPDAPLPEELGPEEKGRNLK